MPSPGWYPDPSTPSRLRLWDGQAWTDQTSEQPPPPPPPTSPPPAHPPGQPPGAAPTAAPGSSWPAMPPTPTPGPGSWVGPGITPKPGPGRSKVGLLVALAVVLVAVVATGGFFGIRALTGSDETDDPAVQATDEPSQEPSEDPSEEPTEEPSEPSAPASPSAPSAPSEPAADQCLSGVPELREDHPQDGAVYGGGLTIPNPEGYSNAALSFTYTFASDVQVVGRSLPGNYIATYSLSKVSKEAFDSVQSAAQEVVYCITESEDFYPRSADRKLGDTGTTRVDGNEAWSAQAEMRLEDAAIPGGVIRVIAVDLGDEESFGLFVAIMPIGDKQLIAQRDLIIKKLAVD